MDIMLFKILYFKNLSEVNSLAFPVSCTGPVLFSISPTQSSSSQCHYIIGKLGAGVGILILFDCDYYRPSFSFLLPFFFFFQTQLHFFFLSSFCPRLKFSLDSLS